MRWLYSLQSPPYTYLMKLRHSFTCGISIAAMSACAALAQEGAPKGPPPGGDGAGRLGEYMKRADANSDGKISKEEFTAASQKESEERFSKADANSDGFVDDKEISDIAARMREAHKGGDRKDGFRRGPDDRPDGDRPKGRPDGDRPKGRPDGDRPKGGPDGRRPGMPNVDEMFGRMDKNSDGSVDREEYSEFAKQEVEQRFGRMDGDNDGKVSKEELKTGIDRMRSFMGRGRGPGGPDGRRPDREGGFRRPPTESSQPPAPKAEEGQPPGV